MPPAAGPLTLPFQTLYAELLEQCALDAFDQAFPEAGTFPAAIWKATMDAALFGRPATLFPTPPANARAPMRLYLPGVDCPSANTVPPTTAPATESSVPVDPTASTTVAPTTTTSAPTTTTTAVPVPGVITDINTTIPRGQVDPTWPVPTLPIADYSFPSCS